METVTVYHATTKDRVQKCLSEGLIPYKTTEADQLAIDLDNHIDSVRPDSIIQHNLTRSGSVYAHLELDKAVTYHNGLWLQKYKNSLAYIAIEVDSSKAFVADIYTGPFKRFQAPMYWASVKKLDEYLDCKSSGKNPTFLAPNSNISSGLNPKYWKEFDYIWLEILLPGGAEANALSLVPENKIKEIEAIPEWDR